MYVCLSICLSTHPSIPSPRRLAPQRRAQAAQGLIQMQVSLSWLWLAKADQRIGQTDCGFSEADSSKLEASSDYLVVGPSPDNRQTDGCTDLWKEFLPSCCNIILYQV